MEMIWEYLEHFMFFWRGQAAINSRLVYRYIERGKELNKAFIKASVSNCGKINSKKCILRSKSFINQIINDA